MIERYSRKEMNKIWNVENKFSTFLKIEILACEAWNKLKVIPTSDLNLIRKKSKFNLERIEEIENEVHHDVIAFTRCVSESLGNEKKWIHYGLTSTDVVDTANAVIFKQANEIIKKDLISFIQMLKNKAIKYKKTPCVGRTHGIHADITSFGLKWLNWYDEMKRNYERFVHVSKNIETGKLSGPVGNFTNINPSVQDYVCKKLDLTSAKMSTQVISRDVYADYFSCLAIVASTIEKIATEIRHLQRTEIREVEENFGNKQKGSSAMPHKKNPIASENMCGCARIMRGYAFTSFENINLWHERDISHSSAERIIMADATTLIDYMLNRYQNVLENLIINQKQMLNNIYSTNGVLFAQYVMHALINKGIVREKAYDLIQPIAIKSYNEHIDFKNMLLTNKDICKILTKKEIDQCFDIEKCLSNVDHIYIINGMRS